MKPCTDAGRRLSDEQLRQILTRAAALDRHGEVRLTDADVREIARDVQISPAAVERAIAEALASQPIEKRVVPADPRQWKHVIRAAALIASGASVGPIALAADPSGLGPEASLLVLGGTAAIAAWRALRNRSVGKLSTYETELALVMATATASLGVVQSVDAAQVGLVWWAILAIAGAGIVELVRRPTSREGEANIAQPEV